MFSHYFSEACGQVLALVAAKLVLQDFAEQEKSDTTKHSLGEKVGRFHQR
jgi:hypothetical protein